MKYSFSELVTFARTGLNPRKNFVLQSKGNPYITIKNIKNGKLIIDNNTDYVDDDAIRMIHKRSKIKKGDILFASIGRMGDMYIIDEEPVGWDINESVFAFTLNTKIIRQKYFYYLFKSNEVRDYLKNNSSGSTFASIKMNQLAKMEFEIPSLNEQDKIINILDKIVEIIDNISNRYDLYNELIKSIYSKMFSDCPTKKMSEIALISAGQSSPKDIDFCNEGTPFIKAGNLEGLENGKYTENDCNIVNYQIAKKYKLKIHSKGTVLVAKSGMSCLTGHVYVLKKDAYVVCHLACIEPKKIEYSNFIRYFFLINGLSELIKDSSYPSIQLSTFEETMIPDATFDDIIKFSNFVNVIDRVKENILKQQAKTQELFETQMAKYFSKEED